MASDLGFSAAANLPSIGLPDDITRLLSRLPSDRIHVMLASIEIWVPFVCRVHNMSCSLSSFQVDEAQSFFLLEKTGGLIDSDAVAASRRWVEWRAKGCHTRTSSVLKIIANCYVQVLQVLDHSQPLSCHLGEIYLWMAMWLSHISHT